jgi:hypothetical protein
MSGCSRRRCGKEASHTPCCSVESHGYDLCCECYRRTHFVEVGNCCTRYGVATVLYEEMYPLEEREAGVFGSERFDDCEWIADRILALGGVRS